MPRWVRVAADARSWHVLSKTRFDEAAVMGIKVRHFP